MKPSDIAGKLIRIANGINASKHPSISLVTSDIRRVLASLPVPEEKNVIVNTSTHSDLEHRYDDGDNIDLQCDVSHVGTINSEPFEIRYKVTVSVDTEDKISVNPDEEEDLHILMNGVELSDEDPRKFTLIRDIVNSKSYLMAELTMDRKIMEEASNSAAIADWKYELADSDALAKNPHKYYGVDPGDFY